MSLSFSPWYKTLGKSKELPLVPRIVSQPRSVLLDHFGSDVTVTNTLAYHIAVFLTGIKNVSLVKSLLLPFLKDFELKLKWEGEIAPFGDDSSY